jgi:hypothetical protein
LAVSPWLSQSSMIQAALSSHCLIFVGAYIISISHDPYLQIQGHLWQWWLSAQHPNPTPTPSHPCGTITLLGYGGSREAVFFRSWHTSNVSSAPDGLFGAEAISNRRRRGLLMIGAYSAGPYRLCKYGVWYVARQ